MKVLPIKDTDDSIVGQVLEGSWGRGPNVPAASPLRIHVAHPILLIHWEGAGEEPWWQRREASSLLSVLLRMKQQLSHGGPFRDVVLGERF